LLEGNTLAALDLLREARVLDGAFVSQVKKDYLFLRALNIACSCLRTVRPMPCPEPAELAALAEGSGAEADRFMTELNEWSGEGEKRVLESLGIRL